ncbi:conserved hypothetical protein [Perkinsus marinus ATCC 50983]|uniref:Ectonucleotide pyrophosphatase/phosphodiesterase n=1 Tax=Perkinsus marinus (strain ATCC 50983 / TXsc) TaxID=423536 RepID=C5L3I4_PERM5|nr:conserved hypothetical protein [Perkinsus marinus ATCC 50983]EER08563.1 conserved hypothetical protein [Perkinsus marinus ATCC 50983]|eukprot:XP_002776747.1 conserved hypothetical protein [Perkinsus marinus ATCC 50983]
MSTSADFVTAKKWLSTGKLVHPLSSVTSVDVITALMGKYQTEVAKGLEKTLLRTEAQHTVFVLLDGCGINVLEKHLGKDSFMRKNLIGTVNSVFPATTCAALTSYGTGKYPAEHGMLGWTTEIDRRVAIQPLPWVDAVTGESLEDTEEMRKKVFRFDAAYDKLDKDEVRMYQFYDDSPFTRAIRGNGPKVIKTSLTDLQLVIVEVPKYLQEKTDSKETTFTYIYCPEPDTTEHALGIDDPAIGIKLNQLNDQLEELWAALSRTSGASVRMVVSADHGQLNLEHVRVYDSQDERKTRPNVLALGRLLKLPPTVEPRSFALHLADGVSVDEARETIRKEAPELAKNWLLLTPDEVEALRILGPGKLSEDAREQLGDLFGITDGPYELTYYIDGKSGTEKLVGQHGGLLPSEVRIPLIVLDSTQSVERMQTDLATIKNVYSADFASSRP